jgi:signal transduction histidine kinase
MLDSVRALVHVKEADAWSASQYLATIAGSFRSSAMHGVLAPLQDIELFVYSAENDIKRGSSHLVPERLAGIRSGMTEVKSCVMNFLAATASGSALEHYHYLPEPPQSELIDPREATQQVVGDYRRLAERKGMEFAVRMDSRARLPMTKDRFILMLSNLVHNAVKYGHRNTKIKISGTDRGHDFVLDVTSYGIPISEEERERIFLLGYRTAAAIAAEYVGVGAGLHLARGVAEEAGGRLFVHSSIFEEKAAEGDRYRNAFRFVIGVREES